MQEIEAKFRVKNFRNITPKLRKIKARLVWRGIEECFFFTNKRHNLRLKKWPGYSNTLTLKTEPKRLSKKYKIRNEYQIEVNDIKITRDMLKILGFVEHFQYKKYREHWKWKDASIELDKIKNMHFVEIEGSKKRINELARILKLDWQQSTTKGYLAILKELKAVK